jgi:hypothetical protein
MPKPKLLMFEFRGEMGLWGSSIIVKVDDKGIRITRAREHNMDGLTEYRIVSTPGSHEIGSQKYYERATFKSQYRGHEGSSEFSNPKPWEKIPSNYQSLFKLLLEDPEKLKKKLEKKGIDLDNKMKNENKPSIT